MYVPDQTKTAIYKKRYQQYLQFGKHIEDIMERSKHSAALKSSFAG
jgi:hypothetical protein